MAPKVNNPVFGIRIPYRDDDTPTTYNMRVLSSMDVDVTDILNKMSCIPSDAGILSRTYLGYHVDDLYIELRDYAPIDETYEPINKNDDYKYYLYLMGVLKNIEHDKAHASVLIRLMILGYYYAKYVADDMLYEPREEGEEGDTVSGTWISYLSQDYLSKDREYPWRGTDNELYQLQMLHHTFGTIAGIVYDDEDVRYSLETIDLDTFASTLNIAENFKSSLNDILNDIDLVLGTTLGDVTPEDSMWLNEPCYGDHMDSGYIEGGNSGQFG